MINLESIKKMYSDKPLSLKSTLAANECRSVSDDSVKKTLIYVIKNEPVSQQNIIKGTGLSRSVVARALLALKSNEDINIGVRKVGRVSSNIISVNEKCSEYRKRQALRVPKAKTLDRVILAVKNNPNANLLTLIKSSELVSHTVKRSLEHLIDRGIIIAEKIGMAGGYPIHKYNLKG